MTPLLPASLSPFRAACVRGFLVLFTAGALSSALLAQTDSAPTPPDESAPNTRMRRAQNNDANGNGANNGNRGNFNPEEMQKRMMAAMREQFGVTDDEEWKLISDRITKVSELRRATIMAGLGGLRGGNRVGRQGGAGNPEQDSLRQAITDKLPDAEIKARLERLREARKANEEKLTKAQDDLRAVLSVRQEAVAVMVGLLP